MRIFGPSLVPTTKRPEAQYGKKMRTIHNMAISDHNPKEMTIHRRRMRPISKIKNPTIGWEKLQEENTGEMYREATARKQQEREEEIQEGAEN